MHYNNYCITCVYIFIQAVKIVGDIEDRLQGKHSKGLPLSVKGQVHVLIMVGKTMQFIN